MIRTIAAAVLIAVTLAGRVEPASAQGWAVDLSAGQVVHEPVPGSVSAFGATIGVRHEAPRWFYASAGLPFDADGLPWGALGAGSRFARGAGDIIYGIDAAGHGYAFRDRTAQVSGGGGTLEAMPLVSLESGVARLTLRSGLRHHASTFSGQSQSRSVHQSDVRAALTSGAVRVSGEARYLRAAEDAYPYVGAAGELAAGAVELWAYGGRWFSDIIEKPVFGAGARTRLGPAVEVYASFQQETNDPLYWNAPRRSWSIGVSRSFGSGHAATRPIAPEVHGTTVTFRIPASEARQAPALGGDFTGWDTVPMVRAGAFWSVTLPVPPGVYRYAFRRADGTWFVPAAVPGRSDDGFGGHSATLIVPCTVGCS